MQEGSELQPLFVHENRVLVYNLECPVSQIMNNKRYNVNPKIINKWKINKDGINKKLKHNESNKCEVSFISRSLLIRIRPKEKTLGNKAIAYKGVLS